MTHQIGDRVLIRGLSYSKWDARGYVGKIDKIYPDEVFKGYTIRIPCPSKDGVMIHRLFKPTDVKDLFIAACEEALENGE